MSLKSAHTVKIGKKFQNQRLSKSMTLPEVSAETYISVSYLQAIESGDYSIFPARMFALRYYERYAFFLNISQPFFDIYNPDNILIGDERSQEPLLFGGFRDKISLTMLAFIVGVIIFSVIFFNGRLTNSTDISKLSASASIPAKQINKMDLSDAQIASLHSQVSLLNTAGLLDQKPVNTMYKLEVLEGSYNLLLLRFNEDSSIKVSEGGIIIADQLFKKGDIFKASVAPPFKVLTGNSQGIVGFFGNEEINFIQIAKTPNTISVEEFE